MSEFTFSAKQPTMKTSKKVITVVSAHTLRVRGFTFKALPLTVLYKQ